MEDQRRRMLPEQRLAVAVIARAMLDRLKMLDGQSILQCTKFEEQTAVDCIDKGEGAFWLEIAGYDAAALMPRLQKLVAEYQHDGDLKTHARNLTKLDSLWRGLRYVGY